jgi:hypothetical protein
MAGFSENTLEVPMLSLAGQTFEMGNYQADFFARGKRYIKHSPHGIKTNNTV